MPINLKLVLVFAKLVLTNIFLTTQGPGMIVGEDLKEAIRSHHDIDKNDAPFLKKASRFYEGLAQRAAKNGHTVDIFSAALHQTGLHEMRHLTMLTGYVM